MPRGASSEQSDSLASRREEAGDGEAPCIACGGTSRRPIWEVRGYEIVACGCGLASTVLPEGFDAASIYSEEYFQGGHADGYADYAASRGALAAEFRRSLDAIRRQEVRGGTLLEIGCAYGFFLDEAARDFSVYGVEVSDHARSTCTARGLRVLRDLPADGDGLPAFDVGVMLDVIEHLERPCDVLDRVHAVLKPGAPLLITTGDFGSLFARMTGRRWRLMTPPQHLWFFSPSTIRRLLERHGFAVREVRHPWKLVPVELIAYQAARYVGGQAAVRRLTLPGFVPVNLFDAMRVIATRE